MPLVAVCFGIDAGSRRELAGEEGAAHLLEHMLFKGAGKWKRGEIDREIGEFGGKLAASTTADGMYLSILAPKANWKRAFEILAEVVRHPTFPSEEFEKEKRVVSDELALRRLEGSPALAKLYAIGFPEHPYRHDPGGTRETLSKLSLAAVAQFWKANFDPSRCVISVAGDVANSEVDAASKEFLGDWLSIESKTDSPKSRASNKLWRYEGRDEIALGYPAPSSANGADVATGLIIEALLNDGRMNGAEAISTNAFYAPRRDVSVFMVKSSGAFDDPAARERQMTSAIAQLADSPVSSAELSNAKSRALDILKIERQTLMGIAKWNCAAALCGGDDWLALKRRFDRVDGKTVSQFIKKNWLAGAAQLETVKAANDPAMSGAFVSEPFKPAEYSALSNGTTIVLTPIPESAECVVSVAIRLQPESDPAQRAVGLLVSRAIFFGSLHRSFQAIASTAQRTGGVEFIKTPEYVLYTIRTRAERIREAAYLVCEAIKNADFTDESLQLARTQIAHEKSAKRNDRETAEAALISQLTSGESSDEELKRVTQDQALAYFKSRYVADRTIVSIAGDFDPGITRRTFDNNLFDFERKSSGRQTEFMEPELPISGTRSETHVGQAPRAFVGFPGPSPNSADYPSFLVMTALLGGSNESRLFTEIRDQKGLAYTAGASLLYPLANAIMIGIEQGEARPDFTSRQMSEAVDAQLDQLINGRVTEDELRRAKASILLTDISRLETPRTAAISLGVEAALAIGALSHSTLTERIAQVTPESVRKAAAIYLTARRAYLFSPRN